MLIAQIKVSTHLETRSQNNFWLNSLCWLPLRERWLFCMWTLWLWCNKNFVSFKISIKQPQKRQLTRSPCNRRAPMLQPDVCRRPTFAVRWSWLNVAVLLKWINIRKSVRNLIEWTIAHRFDTRPCHVMYLREQKRGPTSVCRWRFARCRTCP